MTTETYSAQRANLTGVKELVEEYKAAREVAKDVLKDYELALQDYSDSDDSKKLDVLLRDSKIFVQIYTNKVESLVKASKSLESKIKAELCKVLDEDCKVITKKRISLIRQHVKALGE